MSEFSDVPVSKETPLKSSEIVLAPRAKRYTTAFKLRVIDEADRCLGKGEVGALVRREGIHSSTLANFRRQKACGFLDGNFAAKSIKSSANSAALTALSASNRELRRVRHELECATALLELQKKVSEIMGLTLSRS